MKIINLLPKPKQQELKYEAIFHSLLMVLWVTLGSFLLVFAIQFATKFYLEFEAKSIANNIVVLQQAVNKQDNTTVKTEVTAVNNVVLDFKNLSDSSPKWSKLIKAFVPLVPDGVHINSLTVDAKNKNVLVTGYSPTRELVIEFYNNVLADSDHFSNIDYPLENVSKRTNINFHNSFLVKDSVIK
jgi:Tfp pilus assembly protein PilN